MYKINDVSTGLPNEYGTLPSKLFTLFSGLKC